MAGYRFLSTTKILKQPKPRFVNLSILVTSPSRLTTQFARSHWRKRRLISRAIACLNRGVEAAPDDAALQEALSAAHAALWTTYAQLGLERLTREMPWREKAGVSTRL